MSKAKLIPLCLVAFLLTMASCSIQPVIVKRMDNLEFKNILVKPEVGFELVIFNPNKVGVTLVSLDSEVSINGNALADVRLGTRTRIPAGAEIRIPFLAVPSIGPLTRIFMSGKVPDKATCQGELKVRKFIFTKNVPFKEDYNL